MLLDNQLRRGGLDERCFLRVEFQIFLKFFLRRKQLAIADDVWNCKSLFSVKLVLHSVCCVTLVGFWCVRGVLHLTIRNLVLFSTA